MAEILTHQGFGGVTPYRYKYAIYYSSDSMEHDVVFARVSQSVTPVPSKRSRERSQKGLFCASKQAQILNKGGQ